MYSSFGAVEVDLFIKKECLSFQEYQRFSNVKRLGDRSGNREVSFEFHKKLVADC